VWFVSGDYLPCVLGFGLLGASCGFWRVFLRAGWMRLEKILL
jgi:hypothetical protein